MTLDTPSRERLKLVYLDFAQHVMNVYSYMYDTHNLTMRVTESLRTFEEEDALYAKGRTEPGRIVTNARGGFSYHNFGLAVDSCFLGNDPYLTKDPKGDFFWNEFGARCQLEGLVWGGNFSKLRDTPHCEMSYGHSLSELRAMYNDGGLRHVWEQIDLERENANH